MAVVDPTLFAGQPLDGEYVMQGGAGAGADQPLVAPREISQALLMAGDPAVLAGASARQAADRERATWLESLGASVSNWDSIHLAKKLFTDDHMFEPTPGYNGAAFARGVPLQLTEPEMTYLLKAQSIPDSQYRLEDIQTRRSALQASGDNSSAAFAGAAMDPAYWMLTPAAAGLARVARAGRAGAAVAGGAGAAGIQAGAGGPVSTNEMLLTGLVNAAIPAMIYKPGKGLVKADPDFPSELLRATADSFVGPVGRRLVSPERLEDVITRYEPKPAPEFIRNGNAFEIPVAGSDGKAMGAIRGREYDQAVIVQDSAVRYDLRRGELLADQYQRLADYALGQGKQLLSSSSVDEDAIKAYAALTKQGYTVNRWRGAAPVDRRGKVTLESADDSPVFSVVAGPAEAKTTRKISAVYEDYTPELAPGAVNTDPVAVVKAVDNELKTKAQELGEAGQWNMRKTMSNFGPAGKKVADLLFDNNSDLSKTSVEAHRAAIRADLTSLQHVYEDSMLKAMSEDGYGLLKRLYKPGEASKAQAQIEKDVQMELFRREQLQRQGRPITHEGVSPRVKEMADALDALHARSLQELKAAGVEGAEDLVTKAGWHHRTWSAQAIEDMTQKFVKAGQSADEAHQSVVKLLAGSFRRANDWDSQLAYDVAASTINRALRKGNFEDSVMNGVADEGTLKQMRDILKEEGITGQRLERVLDVMRQKADDTGKAGFLQHRVDMDYKAGTFLNGEQLNVTDLLDNRLTHTVDRYLDGVATQAALARKGLTKRSDIAKMREELIADIPNHQKRGEAAQLFDNVMNHMQGNPAGEDVPRAFRLMQSYGRMISLANSGLWQTTEYATLMAKYGGLKAIKYALAEAPGFKGLLETAAKDKRTSGHLKDILTRHSEQNLRLRPFIQRFEDNFVMAGEDSMSMAAQQGQQLVPYVNAMKFIHSHQARVTSNLILNRLEMAAKGNSDALAALQKYGLDSQVMDKLKPAIAQHGFNVDKWGDALWAQVRPAFSKMMDESVLHARMGDMPAFAAFDKVGKFLFTYRSFMLSAHNKVLMGTLARDGTTPTTLLLAYQFPLAALAVQAQSGLQGKGALSTEDMAAKAVGQMGGLGIFGEAAAVISGQKSAFGSPGTIPIDRAYKLAGSVAQGNFGQAGATGLSMVPLAGLTPPVKAVGNLMKEQ